MAGFALSSKLSSEKHLESFAKPLLTHPIIWAHVCISFCSTNLNLDSLACSLDTEISEIQPEPSGLYIFFLLSWISTVFWNRKSFKSFKQGFPGKIIAWKRKSTVVNKFSCNRKSAWQSSVQVKIYHGKFTTGKTVYHLVYSGVCKPHLLSDRKMQERST